jgi:outer membrane protein assembly factor BamB
MKIILINIIIILIINGCTKKADEKLINDRIALLSYTSDLFISAEANPEDIKLEPREIINYWSQSGQNPQNDLPHVESKSKLEKKKKLISDSGKFTNTIQPIVYENTLCNVSTKGFLRCLNLLDKKLVFELDIKYDGDNKYEIIRGGIAYFDEKIILTDGYGQVKVINSNDGSIIWEKNISLPILSSPLIYRGFINFTTLNNKVYSINLLSGDIQWSFQTVFDDKKSIFTATPAAIENLIIVPFSNGEIISFIFDTGEIVWTENVSKISSLSNFDIKDIAANPVVSRDKIYTISNNGRLLSTKLINGLSDWSIETSGSNSPVISGLQMYIVDDEARLICINKNTGDIYWMKQLDKIRKNKKNGKLNNWKGPYLINGLLYLISTHGEVLSVSPVSSEILSKNNLGITGISINPIILTETVIIMDDNSNVYRVD